MREVGMGASTGFVSDLNAQIQSMPDDLLEKLNSTMGNASVEYLESMSSAEQELIKVRIAGIKEVSEAQRKALQSEQDFNAYLANLKVNQEKERIEHESELKKKAIESAYAKEAELEKKLARLKVIEAGTDGKAKNKAQKEAEKVAKQLEAQRTKLGEERVKKITAFQAKLEAKEDKKRKAATAKNIRNEINSGTPLERLSKFNQYSKNADGSWNKTAGLINAVNAISDLAKQLDEKVKSIGSNKSAIDTRLYGSNGRTSFGSHWDAIEQDFQYKIGATGLFKQEDLVQKLNTLVSKGISFNVEQRAFLETFKDKIATTFNATDSTLLRMVRIQQEDTTAGRLGMEAALNAFLNNMYETTEYLSDVASSVRSSLEEMEALMSGAQATEIEYQVQKWMGSMYSVGMSQNAVQSIAQAFGQLAAGDVTAITNGGSGNLMVMAANEAGISIADILAEGLDADNTNRLMQAMVNYLADIAESSADSRVVQQQLANVYGLKASDLRAISNLADKSTMSSVSKNNLSYAGMLGNLNKMADSALFRTSISELIQNVWGNTQYAMAGTIANNPIMYGIQQVATLLDNTVGGISIPDFSVMGTGVSLNTTVADIMRAGNMSVAVLGGLGSLISGLGSTFSGSHMLSKMGIGKGVDQVTRGTGFVAKATGGSDTSFSGMVGNSSSADIQAASLAAANDQREETMVRALEQESNDIPNTVINESILAICDLLKDVISGNSSFHVVMDGSQSSPLIDGLAWSESGSTGAGAGGWGIA